MNIVRFCMLTALLALSAWAAAQIDKTLPGQDLKAVSQQQVMPLVRICESCHGKGGQTTRFDVPALAGKKADFILAALEQFYYYERHCPDVEYENEDGALETQSMCDITNTLNRQEALALGGYFESQLPAMPDSEE